MCHVTTILLLKSKESKFWDEMNEALIRGLSICPECDGTGKVFIGSFEQWNPGNNEKKINPYAKCLKCKGTGEIHDQMRKLQ